MRRNIEKHILLNRDEAEDLRKKADRACLSEAGLIRMLLKGYEPREQPSKEFYEAMQELNAIGNNLNQLVAKANSLGFIDVPAIEQEARRSLEFQYKIEDQFLLPVEGNLKWQ